MSQKIPTYTIDNVEEIDLLQSKMFLEQVLEIISRSYGPDYSNAMILNGPSLQVVHDGYTILRGLATLHPFCKHLLDILVSISGRLNLTVGDGTTSSVVLAILLASSVIDYVDKHPNESKNITKSIIRVIDNVISKHISDNNITLSQIMNLALTGMGKSVNDSLTTIESKLISNIINLFDNESTYGDYIDIRSNTMNKILSYTVKGFEFTGGHGDYMFEYDLHQKDNEWAIKNTNIILIPAETTNDFTKLIMLLASDEAFMKALLTTYKGEKYTFIASKFAKSLFNVYHESLYDLFDKHCGYQVFTFLEYNKSIMETNGTLDDFIELYNLPIIDSVQLNNIYSSEDFHQALIGVSLQDVDIHGFSSTKNGINDQFYIDDKQDNFSDIYQESRNKIADRLRMEIDKCRNLSKQIGSYSEMMDVVKYEKRLANLRKRKILSIGSESIISTNYYMKIAEDCVKVILSSIRSGVVLGQFSTTNSIILEELANIDKSHQDYYIYYLLLDCIKQTNKLAISSYPDNYSLYPINFTTNELCDYVITSQEHDVEILKGLKDFIHTLMTTEWVVSDYILPS